MTETVEFNDCFEVDCVNCTPFDDDGLLTEGIGGDVYSVPPNTSEFSLLGRLLEPLHHYLQGLVSAQVRLRCRFFTPISRTEITPPSTTAPFAPTPTWCKLFRVPSMLTIGNEAIMSVHLLEAASELELCNSFGWIGISVDDVPTCECQNEDIIYKKIEK